MNIYQAQREVLKDFRKMLGMSQMDLANKMDLNVQSIWAYENKGSIPLDKVLRLCEVFNISLPTWYAVVSNIYEKELKHENQK